jgi:pimeloyl-ACP methyl ester carboxylesterase
MTIEHEPIKSPDTRRALQELWLPLDAVRWAPAWLALKRQRTAHPQTVLLLPGFGATHRSWVVMGAYLRRVGHDVHDWGLGRNTGLVSKLLPAVSARVEKLVADAGHPVMLVGWSLGGYLARELARDHPERVRKVITLGSPVIGGPRYTAVGSWYQSKGYDLDAIERGVAARFATPLRVPVTAIYSKRDGVVAWQACIDHWSANVRHIEVSETHLGMGFSPRVLSIVAEELELR